MEKVRDVSSSVAVGEGVGAAAAIAAEGEGPPRPFAKSRLPSESSRSARDGSGRVILDLPTKGGSPSAAAGVRSHGALEPSNLAHGLSRDGPAHRYGTQLPDLYAHSWRQIPNASWLWIPKHGCVDELGFVAMESEVIRLGSWARTVRRVRDPPPLHRCFVEAVKEGLMERGRSRYPRRFGEGRVSRHWAGGRGAPLMSERRKMT